MMTLLIVDDQYTILDMLVHKVNWREIGVDRVLTAQNAMEARLAFRAAGEDGIQVMLTDIEMPVENGVELCRWVRSQNYHTKITFLTCHSDFEYAKEAISLNVMDYLVQPAPIADIQNAVAKMVDQYNQEASLKATHDMAETLRKKRPFVLASSLQNFLRNNTTPVVLESVGGLSIQSQRGYLLLAHMLHWREAQEQWPGSLVITALSSFLTDIFAPYHLDNICGQMDETTYCAFLYLTGEDVCHGDLSAQLQYLCGVFELYMPFDIACCVSGCVSMAELPDEWQKLRKLQSSNVSHRKGLIASELGQDKLFEIPENHWRELLNTHEAMEFSREILEWLESREINQTNLQALYQTFARILYAGDDGKKRMNALFETPGFVELFGRGMQSVEQMKALVQFVANEEMKQQSGEASDDIVGELIEYINEHLTDNITREDLSELVHMNADYIARVFRKKMGMSPKSYIIQKKMELARDLLQTTNLPVSHVAVHLGYTNFSHFSAAYKKQFGVSPQSGRKQ